MNRTARFSYFAVPYISLVWMLTTVNIASGQTEAADDVQWSNSFFVAGGYGTPQGTRYEIGYTVSAGIVGLSGGWSLGFGHEWATTTDNGMPGPLLMARMPVTRTISPYLIFNPGLDLTVFAKGASFLMIGAGLIFSVTRWTHLRFEYDIVRSSECVDDCGSLFGGAGDNPVSEKLTHYGFTVSLELSKR